MSIRPGLDALIRPRSIAVIGASEDRTKNAGKPVHFLKEHGYEGAVYPVNPRYSSVLGVRAYPSVLDIPGPVDAAVIVVPAAHVRQAVEECGQHGVKAAVVISSGFGELGAEGLRAEAELVALARRSGLRLCGPNSVGIINTHDRVFATFSQAADGRALPPGSVAMVSQSGNFGTFMFELALQRGLGISHFISSGNEADLTFLDYVEYLVADPSVRAIVGYVEGLRDAARLRAVGAAALQAGKPIVLLKVGRSSAAARSALSHTGALVGDDALYDTALRQAHIVRVETEEEMLDTLPLLLADHRPRGRRVGVISISGGGATIVADACESEGLEVPVFGEATQGALRSVVPYYGAVGNPVDLTGQVLTTQGSIQHCLKVALDEPAIDSVILFLGLMQRLGERVSDEILRAADQGDKPLVVSWVAGPDEPIMRLRRAGLCVTRAPASACARALAHAVRYHAWSQTATPPSPPPPRGAAAPAVSPAILPAARARELLAQWGIPVPVSLVVADADAAVAAARQLGGSIALKIERPTVAHKTEVGALRLNLVGPEEVRTAAEALLALARRLAPGEAEPRLAVETMMPPGREVLISGYRSPEFGPVLCFGLGGIYTELLGDAVTRLIPVSRAEVEAMCAESRASVLLDGFRGQEPADREMVTGVLLSVASALEKNPEVELVEINPFVVYPRGRGGVAVDALIGVRAR